MEVTGIGPWGDCGGVQTDVKSIGIGGVVQVFSPASAGWATIDEIKNYDTLMMKYKIKRGPNFPNISTNLYNNFAYTETKTTKKMPKQ